MDLTSPTYLAALSAVIATTVSGLINGVIAVWNSRQNRKAEERRWKNEREAEELRRKQDREAEEHRYVRDREAEEMRHKRDREAEDKRQILELEAEERKHSGEQNAESSKQVRELAVRLALEAWHRKVEFWKENEGKGPVLSGPRPEPVLADVVGDYFRAVDALDKQ